MEIFISYRRQDSEWVTLTLYNELKQHLPEYRIFKDFNTIKPGEDFIKAIDNNLKSCDVLLVVIGNQWLNCKDSEGNQRIFKEKDFVRLEIARALKTGKKVIPILIDNAVMPGDEELPDNIKSLHNKQSIKVSNVNFELDVFNIANSIKEVTGKSTEYSRLVHDITTGKVNEKELLKPETNQAYGWVAVGIGLLILLLNYDHLATSIICIGMIAAGAYALFLSGKIKGLWLNKKFEDARFHAKKTKWISILSPIIGLILIFISILYDGFKLIGNDEEMKKLQNLITNVQQNQNQQQNNTPNQNSNLVPIDRTQLKPLHEIHPDGKYPETSERYLTDDDLQYKNSNELRIMRNEIFARKGFIFENADLDNYFRSQSWYNPRYTDVSNLITDIEKANIALIKIYE